MLSAVIEAEFGARNEILDRARHEHLARGSERRDAGSDRDRDAGNLAVGDLALTGVQPGPNLDVELAERVEAARTARAGPSKAAKNPSPAVSSSRPWKRASSRRTIA